MNGTASIMSSTFSEDFSNILHTFNIVVLNKTPGTTMFVSSSSASSSSSSTYLFAAPASVSCFYFVVGCICLSIKHFGFVPFPASAVFLFVLGD